jgi:hypothetical protein
MTEVVKGANILLTRNLIQVDGVTSLPYSTLYSVDVTLCQRGLSLASYSVSVDGPLRAGSDGYSVTLELTSALTNSCVYGTLTEVWTLKKANALFVSEPTYEVHVITISDVSITAACQG